MKNINRLTFGIAISCLILLSLQSVVYADTIDNNELLTQFKSLMTQSDLRFDEYDLEDLEQPFWYPGFLIVQLIKGIIAFIVVLLILFDIIDPDEQSTSMI